jgi:hypothetical protein
MTSEDRFKALEFELNQVRASLKNLEMAIAPLNHEHIKRICWISKVLQPRVTPFELARLGSKGDGGYILGPLSFGETTISIGIGEEISTDLELINNYGHRVYAFDPYVEHPKDVPENFIFKKIGLAENSKDLPSNLVFENIRRIMKRIPETPELALIDIEGSEWDLAGSFAPLREVKQIAIEFHRLDKIVDDRQFKRMKKLFLEITDSHFPVHVHANNDGPTLRISGAAWPSILEVTFIRKDQFDDGTPSYNFGPWPGKLDYPNSLNRPDINLEAFFGMEAVYRQP